MPWLEQIPILVVESMERALDFYSRTLGFEIAFRAVDPPSYAGLRKDSVQLHLIHTALARQPSGGGRLSIVTDAVDSVYARCKTEHVEIAVEIGDRPYGLRDFNVRDPDGNVIVFGMELRAAVRPGQPPLPEKSS